MTARHTLPSRLSAVPVIAAALLLGSCDWVNGSSTVDTQLRNVEIQPGTASDEMITLDQASGDGTSIDTSAAIGPALPGAPSAADDAAATAAGADTPDSAETPDASDSGDVTIRPPAGGAERSE